MPALVRLIEAYIERDVAFIVRAGHVERVLGVFQVQCTSATNQKQSSLQLC